ncbi:MAG TPA: hypothetical protein VFU71_21515 [Burkholderiaceae bacterium]|nr:hypothetical protein [Burkholderiaceae bacterium]
MTRHPLATLAGAAALALPWPAHAQTAITLYGGYRAGSGFEQAQPPNNAVDMRSTAAGSIGIEWPSASARPFQLLLSYQRTRLDLGPQTTPGAPTELPLQVGYVHFGGLNYFEGQVAGRGPYVAGGLGVTFMNPDFPGTSGRVRPSMNVGIGYQWPLSQSLALRTELRAYLTAISSSGSFFCSGGCVVQVQSTLMTQYEAMIGLTFGF